MGPALVHEITELAPDDDHAVVECGPGARIVTIPSPGFPLDRKYWYFDNEAAVRAALDAETPDFVEVSSPWRSPAMVARWPGQVPRSLIMHADPLSAHAYRWLEPVLSRETIDRRFEPFCSHLRLMGRSYDWVVCASRELRGRLATGGVLNTALHPMGIEAGLFSPARRSQLLRQKLLELCELPESAHLLIGVGRLSAEKRWLLVVDAVTAASQSRPIGLVIFGQGNQKHRILRQIAGNPHIRIIKPELNRANFAAILASADALIYGCEAETFCMAAAESRASGIPLIIPDRGGAADHARGGAGRIYKAGNALAAAHAISAFLAESRAILLSAPLTMLDHFSGLFSDYTGLAASQSRVA